MITIGLAGKMFGMCEIGISHLWRFSHQKNYAATLESRNVQIMAREVAQAAGIHTR